MKSEGFLHVPNDCFYLHCCQLQHLQEDLVYNYYYRIDRIDCTDFKDKEAMDYESDCVFKVDEHGFFISWKSDSKVNETK